MLSEPQIRRFSRHILLKEVGGRGQRRLLDAELRLPRLDEAHRSAALWLARAGVGSLVLPLDPSPAPAADPAGLLLASDAGRPLSEAVAERLRAHFPEIALRCVDQELGVDQERGVGQDDEATDPLPLLDGPQGALSVLRRLLREPQ